MEKILATETLIFLAGVFLIGSGFYTGDPMQYFFGGVIICGSIVLHFVRKKDWKKHWEEQEALQKLYDERRKTRDGTKNDQ
jgi:hypothetical protein